jgi:hypothetical protein
MLRVLDALKTDGHDMIHLWAEWIAALRDLLLARTLPDRTELLSRSGDEARALGEAAAGLSVEDLVRAFQILAELEPGLKGSSRADRRDPRRARNGTAAAGAVGRARAKKKRMGRR